MATDAAHILIRGLDDLHRMRLRTLELMAPLSQQDLDLVPAPGQWSVGEIADHIILAADVLREILEEAIRLKRSGQRPFVRRTLSDFDVWFAFLPKSWLPLMEMPLSLFSSLVPETARNLLIQMRVLPFRAARSSTPRHGLPAPELRSRLMSSFETLKSTFQDNGDLNFQEMTAQHPLFGYITMINLPDLIGSHERRHQKQIIHVLSIQGNPEA